MSQRDPAPFKAIERIWERLTLRYGHQFLSRWDGLNLGAVKEDWRYELAGLTGEQLTFGLENLPATRAPEVGEFRQICLRAPERAGLALPAPRAPTKVPQHLRPVVDHLLHPKAKGDEPYRVVISRRYLQRWEGTQHLTPSQLQNVAHYRGIVDRYERAKDDEATKQAKAEAQRRVDEYQQQGTPS